jgi:segregation and condensation protein A
VDETPIHVHMDRIIEMLRQHERVTLTSLFTPPHTRGRLVGLFLATLELMKGGQVRAEQPDLYGEMWLCLVPAVV